MKYTVSKLSRFNFLLILALSFTFWHYYNQSQESLKKQTLLHQQTEQQLEKNTKVLEETKKDLKEISGALDDLPVLDAVPVTVTAYSPIEGETDSTPQLTAFDTKVSEKIIAVSPNLLQERGWKKGDKIYLAGVGIREISDKTTPRYRNRIDVFYWNTQKAKNFSVKRMIALRIQHA